MKTLFLVFLSAGLASAQLQISTNTVPAATQYQSYVAALQATGGTPPYTWSVVISTNVSLPEGMILDPSSGVVSSPLVYGQGGYAVTIQVTDSAAPNRATTTKILNFGVHSDAGYGGCQMFPPDSIYNQRIDQLPVDTDPSHQIPSAYLNLPLHPDFGTGFYPMPGGIPFIRVPANQPPSNVNLANGGQVQGPGTYVWPVPPWPDVPFEGTAYGADGVDHHILVLQSSVNNIVGPQSGACVLYEAYNSIYVPNMYSAATNTWYMSGGVAYNLGSNQIAASSDTLDNGVNDSAGIPMVPLLMRYNEVPLGVRHPLRIAFPSPTNWFVWPATGCCSGSGPPQGLLYRLKASVNWQAVCPVSNYPQAATVLQALQQYGAYMSDHGSGGYVGGAPDDRWDDDDLACIKHLHVSDLEVVDNSALEVASISGQTQPYVVASTLGGGNVGVAYSASFAEVGGNPANIQWSVASGSLPPGLALNAATGTLTGTIASSAGSPYGFAITATDTGSGLSSGSQPFTISVSGTAGAQLSIAKSHSGNFTLGQNGATYTLSVSNAAGAGATSGTVTVTEILPAGLTLVSMNGGATWNCSAPPSCTTTSALNGGASYPAITVTVNVSTNAGSSLVNQASVSGGGSSSAMASDTAAVYSKCDINQDGATNLLDIQREIAEVLMLLPPLNDLNSDGQVNITDVQIVANAALGSGCAAH